MTFSELVRLLCRLLPWPPQSLQTAPLKQGSNPRAVRVKCRGIPCGSPNS